MACNIREVRQILTRIQNNFECAICLDLLSDPYSTKCNHQFCRDCIMRVTNEQTSVCPLCKKPLSKRSLNHNTSLSAIVQAVNGLVEAVRDDTGAICTPPFIVPSHLSGTPGIRAFSLVHPTPKKSKQQVSSASSEDKQEGTLTSAMSSSRIRAAVRGRRKKNVRQGRLPRHSLPVCPQSATTASISHTPLSNMRRTPAAKKLYEKSHRTPSPPESTLAVSVAPKPYGATPRREESVSVVKADKTSFDTPQRDSSTCANKTIRTSVDPNAAVSKHGCVDLTKNSDDESYGASSVTEQSTRSKNNVISDILETTKPCEPDSVTMETAQTTDPLDEVSQTEKQLKSSSDMLTKPRRLSTMAPDKPKTRSKSWQGMSSRHLVKRLRSVKGTDKSLQHASHARVKTSKGCLRSSRIRAIQQTQILVQTQDELAYLLEQGDASPGTITAIINTIDEQLAENLQSKAQEKTQDELTYLLEQGDVSPGTGTAAIINTVDERLAESLQSKAWEEKRDKLDHLLKKGSASPGSVSGMEPGELANDDPAPCLTEETRDVTVRESSFLHHLSAPPDSLKTDNVDKLSTSPRDEDLSSELTEVNQLTFQATPNTSSVQMNSNKETDVSHTDTNIDHSNSKIAFESQITREEVLASPTVTNSPCPVIDPMVHMSILRSQHPTVSCDVSGDSIANLSLSTSFSPQPVEPCSPMEAEPNLSPVATRSPALLSPKVTSSSPKGTSIIMSSFSTGTLSSTVMSSSLNVASSVKMTSQLPRKPSDDLLFVKPSGCGSVSRKRSKKSTEDDSAPSENAGIADESSITTEACSDLIYDIIPQTPPVSRPLSAPQLSLYSVFSPLIVSPRSTSAPLVSDRGISPSLFSPQARVLSERNRIDGSEKKSDASVLYTCHPPDFEVFPSQPSSDILHPAMTSPSILTHHVASNQPIRQNLPDNLSLSKEKMGVSKPYVPERVDARSYVPSGSSSDEATQPLDLPGNDGCETDRNRPIDKPQRVENYGMETTKQTISRLADLETQSVTPLGSEIQEEEKHVEFILDPDTQSVETINSEGVRRRVVGESNNPVDIPVVLSATPIATGSTQTHSSMRATITKVLTTPTRMGEPSPNKEDRETLTGSILFAKHNGATSTEQSDLTTDFQIGLIVAEPNTFTSSVSEMTGMAEFQESYMLEVQRQLDNRTRELAEVEELLRKESGDQKKRESVICQANTVSEIEVEAEPVSEMNEVSPLSPSLSPSPPPGPPRLSVSQVLSSIGQCKFKRSITPSESLNRSWPGSSCEQNGNPTTDESQSIFAGLKTGRSASLEPLAKRANREVDGFDERCFGAGVIIPSVSSRNQANERVAVSGKEMKRGCERNGKTMSFVTSGLTRNQVAKVKELAMKYGVRLASCFNRNTTHVICKTDENRAATRTVKFLLGVTSGKWVVDYHWVEDCLRESHLLPEEDYEVAGDTGSKNIGGPKAARLRSEQDDKPLLIGETVALVGKFSTVQKDLLCQLLDIAGAQVIMLDSKTSVYEHARKQVIVICDPECGEFKGHWVGLQSPVTVYWITDSLAAHEILPLSQYLVGVETCSYSYTNSSIMDSPYLVPESPLSTREP